MFTEIIPGILSHTFEEYATRLEQVEESEATWVHVDVMDGQFVPNISVMPSEFMGLTTRLKIEAHLMVFAPERYYPDLSAANCTRLLLHQETYEDLEQVARAVKQAKDYFPEVGLAVSPETKLEHLASLGLQSVQCMGVMPGRSGQAMLDGTEARIRALAKQKLGVPIAVDGGVTQENIKELSEAGATRFVITSQLFANNALKQNFTYFSQLVTGGAA